MDGGQRAIVDNVGTTTAVASSTLDTGGSANTHRPPRVLRAPAGHFGRILLKGFKALDLGLLFWLRDAAELLVRGHPLPAIAGPVMESRRACIRATSMQAFVCSAAVLRGGKILFGAGTCQASRCRP